MESIRSFIMGSPSPTRNTTTNLPNNITMDSGNGPLPGDGSMSTVQDEPFISPVLQHILYELLLEKEFPGPIYDAFELLGYTEPFHFIIMDPYDTMILTPSDGPRRELSRPQIHRILALQDFYFHLLHELQIPMLDDTQWMNILYTDIIAYQLNHARNRREQHMPPRSNTSTPRTATGAFFPHEPHSTSDHRLPSDHITEMLFSDDPIMGNIPSPSRSQVDPIFLDAPPSILEAQKPYQLSVKKNPLEYPEYKEDRYYQTWILQVKALAHLHDMSEVLDATYIPDNPWSEEAWKAKQSFMWTVLVNKVKTATGQMFIRKHDRDAQTIFKLLAYEQTASIKAEFNADDLRTKIDALDIGSWKGTYATFLEHWEKQIHLYDQLTINKAEETGFVPLTEAEKKRMLCKALSASGVMVKLTTDENIDKAKNHPQWSYLFYFNLAMTTALEDDRRTNRANKTKRNVHLAHGTSPGRGRGGRGGTSGDTGGRTGRG